MNNRISFRLCDMPLVNIADENTVTVPYKHHDRTRNFHVLLYVKEGLLPVIEEGIEYFLEPGTLFFLKAGLHHWGKHLIPAGTKLYFVHFYLDECDTELNDFKPELSPDRNRIGAAYYKETRLTLPKKLENLKDSDIIFKLKELLDLYNSPDPFRRFRLNNMFLDILIDCCQLSYHSNATESDIRLSEIRSYLFRHKHEPFHSEDLSAHMNLSYKYLGTFFKQKTGMTIQEYHTSLRMHEAARLLRTTTYRISEIGNMIGFDDPLYFSNSFKKATGFSPKAYRARADIQITE